MRTPSHHLLAVCTTVILVLPALAACTPTPTSAPSRTTAATDAPVFASDEEALAAAEKAYAAYLAASDAITGDGGNNPERIATFVSDNLLSSELEGFAGYGAAGAHSVGSTTFTVAGVQDVDSSASLISLYICEDVSSLNVVDATGMTLVSPTRKPLTPFEVGFEMGDASLILSFRNVWEGGGFC